MMDDVFDWADLVFFICSGGWPVRNSKRDRHKYLRQSLLSTSSYIQTNPDCSRISVLLPLPRKTPLPSQKKLESNKIPENKFVKRRILYVREG